MMKSIKKLTSCLILAAMLIILFAGCTSTENISSAQRLIAEKKDEILDNGTGGIKLPNIELENKTIEFYTALKEEELFAEEGESPKAGDLFAAVYGGEIKIVPVVNWSEYSSKLSAMKLSNSIPDIVTGGIPQLTEFIAKELIAPLDDYIDINAPLWSDVKEPIELFSWRGETYLLPYEKGPASYFYYNPKIFEEYGVKTPLEYYEEGTWDWDAFIKIAKELTQDTNGDGAIDLYGANIEGQGKFLVYQMDTTGETLVYYDEEGMPVLNLDSPAIADAANFCRDLTSIKHNVLGGDFAAGTAAMSWVGCQSASEDSGWRNMYTEQWKQGAVDFVPPPRYPKVDEHYLSYRSSASFLGYGCKNPQGAAAFFACQRYAETQEFKAIFDPDGNWKQAYRDKGWTDTQIQRAFVDMQKLPLNPWLFTTWAANEAPSFGDVVWENKSWAQVKEELKPLHLQSIQSKLDAIKAQEEAMKAKGVK